MQIRVLRAFALWGVFGLAFLLSSTALAPKVQAAKKKRIRWSKFNRVYPILRRYCVKCHKPKYKWVRKKIKGKRKRVRVLKKKPAGKLDLSTKAKAYKNMVDVQSKQANEGYNIVTPSEVARSYLIYKLTGQHKNAALGGKGKKMPPKRKLANWRVRRIMKWIKNGAKR